jgi:predicted  nucleic acid-binding Zn-ribbon protein
MTIKSEKHYALESEVQILQANVRELQSQLGAAHKRIAELGNEQNEELTKTKQLLQELSFELNTVKQKEQFIAQPTCEERQMEYLL